MNQNLSKFLRTLGQEDDDEEFEDLYDTQCVECTDFTEDSICEECGMDVCENCLESHTEECSK